MLVETPGIARHRAGWAIIRKECTDKRQILPEMTPAPDASTADRLQTALWIAAGLGVLALFYALAPILTPFLLAGILAYICNPVIDRLTGLGLPRMLAVVLVIVAMVALGAGLVLIILPLLYEEARLLAARLPEALALASEKLVPWLRQNFGCGSSSMWPRCKNSPPATGIPCN
jgi:predicted PurR-regulated permease PerM